MSATAEAVNLVSGIITVFNTQQEMIAKLTTENAGLRQDVLILQAQLVEAMQKDGADVAAIAEVKQQLQSKKLEFELYQAQMNGRLASDAAAEDELAAAMEQLKNQIEVLSRPVDLQPS